jgi:hypothetical protein
MTEKKKPATKPAKRPWRPRAREVMTAVQRKMAMRIMRLSFGQLHAMNTAKNQFHWLALRGREKRQEREACVVRIAKILFPEPRKRRK